MRGRDYRALKEANNIGIGCVWKISEKINAHKTPRAFFVPSSPHITHHVIVSSLYLLGPHTTTTTTTFAITAVTGPLHTPSVLLPIIIRTGPSAAAGGRE